MMPRGELQDAPTTVKACAKLTLEDGCVKKAVASMQASDVNLDFLCQMEHGRPCEPDGIVGPATEMYLKLRERSGCGHADFLTEEEQETAAAAWGLPAQGSGNWRGCHGVGNFHAVKIRVTNSPPSFLAPVFEEVKKRVTEAYAEAGLLIHWDGTASDRNIDFSFVNGSTGWIGLAIVSNNSTCSSGPIWCRYLATYRGGSSVEQIITQWVTLIKHELGHNCGFGHLRGGVMNSTIVNGLVVSFRNDPAWSGLSSRFGGVAVPRTPDDAEKEQWLVWKLPGGSYEDIMQVPRYTADGGGWPVMI